MTIPKFASEEEEARWWYDNRDELDKEFAQAIREGRTTRGAGLNMRERVEAMKKAKASSPIHIRIPDSDLALARALAEKKGMPYQTYLKSLLHEALERESAIR